MALVDAPNAYPESPLEDGEAVFPCKGCGEILEEGKAFELAGNRWHIDCFRCNTCGTLLDSDANLLLLGDGSLICNNCTYSCNACGNKIEDLAILTGDQAFCAACFRCRNCKRKIENLRYARTSQGIFCMSCHESLMARRRKKSKSSKPGTPGTNGSTPIVLDKSLPALPPNAVPVGAFPDVDVPAPEPPAETTDEKTGRSMMPLQQGRLKSDPMAKNIKRDVSPMSDDNRKENLTLPASTYKDDSRLSVSSVSHSDADEGYLPMAFDPSPAVPPISKKRLERKLEEQATPKPTDNVQNKDYFGGRAGQTLSPSNSDLAAKDLTPGTIKAVSPHIAFQEKGRSSSSKRRSNSGRNTPTGGSTFASPPQSPDERPRSNQANTNPNPFGFVPGDSFRLQEAPRSRKASIRSERNKIPDSDGQQSLERSNDSNLTQPELDRSDSIASIGSPSSGYNPFDDPKLRDSSKHPTRGDSLGTAPRKPMLETIPSANDTRNLTVTTTASPHSRSMSAASVPSTFLDSLPQQPHSARSFGKSTDSPLRSDLEAPLAPPRSASRPTAPSKSVANDDFISPRHPPAPPSADRDRRNESVSSLPGFENGQFSPTRGHLPKSSIGGDFSMEDEMSRILKGDEKRREREGSSDSPSVLRRVSNAVRHGRSFSDRAVPLTQRTPNASQMEISSPMNISSPLSSPSMRDDVAALKANLHRAQQRIAELESDKIGLEEKVNGSAEIKQVNTELREKRSTMAFLDTQREMVVRELEIMTDHLAKAKETNQPLNFDDLKSDVLQDFAHSLQRLKDTLGSQIEDLVHKRNELTDEIGNLIQVKDKGLQEFESLSSKNSQLSELNASLVQNIQETYRANRVPSSMNISSPLSNGLGIYAGGAGGIPSSELRSQSSHSQTQSTQDTLVESTEAESAHILAAPQVVNIRKGQPKRFNWKKGGRDVAKNITKGMKGAFAREGQYDANGVLYQNGQAIPGAGMYANDPALRDRQPSESARAQSGLGFFSNQKGGLKPGLSNRNNSSTDLRANDPSVIFGSELSARCDFEKRVIPAMVTRCIEEVEARGIDVEGIYRKSGGSGQVKQIQLGFEKDSGFDITDIDLDIHAVTSCVKQYFRKLPNPLITFEVYDSALEAAQLSDSEQKTLAMKNAIASLPQSHRDVLEYLIQHLRRVVESEAENLMTPLNISVVFAPTIMRPISIEREMTDMQGQREVVRALLDNADMIFD